jgi:hypothetical protein
MKEEEEEENSVVGSTFVRLNFEARYLKKVTKKTINMKEVPLNLFL